MPASLADLIRTARQRLFVGREAEQALFREAITADSLPFHVLYIWGPGGVGKTTLAQAFAAICAEEEIPFFRLDARDLQPEPAAVEEAIAHTVGGGEEKTLASVAAAHERVVLTIDTYEALAPVDRWVCQTFLPALPSNVLLVLCGRRRRSAEWRASLGLRDLVRPLPLRNLPSPESQHYLDRRAVPAEQQDAILAFAQGHPLALSLIADAFDQEPELHFDPGQTPDVVSTLLQRFLDSSPTDLERRAVELSALVRYTTQPLLEAVLDVDQGHALFGWLRGLSFMEADGRGLFPHDLVREVLVADLRWRDADAHQDLLRRVREHYTALLASGHAAAYEVVLSDYLYLHRDNPVIKPFFEQLRLQWSQYRAGVRDHVQPGDVPALKEAVEQYEGREAARWFAFWAERQPDGLYVFRDEAEGAPTGCLVTLTLDHASFDDRAAREDPAVEAARTYLAAHAPLRAGERAVLFRFWLSVAAYQDVSPVQSLIFVQTVRHYLTTPGLAISLLPCADPGFWNFILAYAGLERLESADYEVDGRRFGVYGHDWRVQPPDQWLGMLAERGSALAPAPGKRAATTDLLVLSEPDFAEAVKQALEDFTQVDVLQQNPLLRSRLVLDRVGADPDYGERVEALRQVLLDVAGRMQQAPREAKFYRALEATYLDPAPTQERAAEALDLPFSTYRRHLRSGLDHLTQALWQREIRG